MQPRVKGHSTTPKHPGSLIADSHLSELTPSEKLAQKVMARAFNDAETAEAREYEILSSVMDLLSSLDTKGETLKKISDDMSKAIGAFSSFKQIFSNITPEIVGKGLHVHKISKKSEDLIEKTNRALKEKEDIGKRIGDHYPEIVPQWQDIMEQQTRVIQQAESIKSNLQDFFLGDATVLVGAPTFP